MMQSVDAMCREMGGALIALMGGVPGALTRDTPRGWLALSGVPLPDFNYALLSPDADAALLREFGAAIQDRDLPAIVFLASAVGEALGPVAAELGLQHVGAAPLMVYQPERTGAEPDTGPYQVERVRDEATLRETTPLLASAFSLPLDETNAVYSQSLIARPDIGVFLARRDGEAICSVTTTGAGDVVGIWCMSTPPQYQRQGAARATLAWVIAHHLARGATTFYLGATEAGKRLYDQIGFVTVDELAIWLSGQSTQFH